MCRINLMRYLKLLILVFTSSAAVAVELAYDVTGFANDEQVNGELIGNLDNTCVKGFLLIEADTTRYLIGDWISDSQFGGYDENDGY